MESADNVEILESRFQRAGEGPHLAQPASQRSSRDCRLGAARRPAGPRALCAAGIRCKPPGRGPCAHALRARGAWRRPLLPCGLLRDLLLRPGHGGRGGVGHVAGLAAGLGSARPGGRGSRGPPLQPAGLRKILLGQWQAGRRARIGAGALLITVETRAAGNAGGCGARGGRSQRGGRRRRRGLEHPRVFTGGKSPSRAGGRRTGRRKGTAWGHWEARDIPRDIWQHTPKQSRGGWGRRRGGRRSRRRQKPTARRAWRHTRATGAGRPQRTGYPGR